jgi:hypothetical protein
MTTLPPNKTGFKAALTSTAALISTTLVLTSTAALTSTAEFQALSLQSNDARFLADVKNCRCGELSFSFDDGLVVPVTTTLVQLFFRLVAVVYKDVFVRQAKVSSVIL